jgi:hypothetical protein
VQFVWFWTLTAVCVTACSARTISRPALQGVYGRAIQELGGTVVDAGAYPATVAGFEAYLTDSGVHRVTAAELTQPNHPEVAEKYGFRDFLPPQGWWSRGVALALVIQAIDDLTLATVHVRNWWRPTAYNQDRAIGGAKNGDHPTANAVDLDYQSVTDRMKAERFLRGLCGRFPWMRISLGLGAETTHVGINSPRGHREWHYPGWTPATFRRAVTGG